MQKDVKLEEEVQNTSNVGLGLKNKFYRGIAGLSAAALLLLSSSSSAEARRKPRKAVTTTTSSVTRSVSNQALSLRAQEAVGIATRVEKQPVYKHRFWNIDRQVGLTAKQQKWLQAADKSFPSYISPGVLYLCARGNQQHVINYKTPIKCGDQLPMLRVGNNQTAYEALEDVVRQKLAKPGEDPIAPAFSRLKKIPKAKRERMIRRIMNIMSYVARQNGFNMYMKPGKEGPNDVPFPLEALIAGEAALNGHFNRSDYAIRPKTTKPAATKPETPRVIIVPAYRQPARRQPARGQPARGQPARRPAARPRVRPEARPAHRETTANVTVEVRQQHHKPKPAPSARPATAPQIEEPRNDVVAQPNNEPKVRPRPVTVKPGAEQRQEHEQASGSGQTPEAKRRQTRADRQTLEHRINTNATRLTLADANVGGFGTHEGDYGIYARGVLGINGPADSARPWKLELYLDGGYQSGALPAHRIFGAPTLREGNLLDTNRIRHGFLGTMLKYAQTFDQGRLSKMNLELAYNLWKMMPDEVSITEGPITTGPSSGNLEGGGTWTETGQTTSQTTRKGKGTTNQFSLRTDWGFRLRSGTLTLTLGGATGKTSYLHSSTEHTDTQSTRVEDTSTNDPVEVIHRTTRATDTDTDLQLDEQVSAWYASGLVRLRFDSADSRWGVGGLLHVAGLMNRLHTKLNLTGTTTEDVSHEYSVNGVSENIPSSTNIYNHEPQTSSTDNHENDLHLILGGEGGMHISFMDLEGMLGLNLLKLKSADQKVPVTGYLAALFNSGHFSGGANAYIDGTDLVVYAILGAHKDRSDAKAYAKHLVAQDQLITYGLLPDALKNRVFQYRNITFAPTYNGLHLMGGPIINFATEQVDFILQAQGGWKGHGLTIWYDNRDRDVGASGDINLTPKRARGRWKLRLSAGSGEINGQRDGFGMIGVAYQE